VIAKSVSIKDAGSKSGGRVSKAVELIAGELLHVSDSGLRVEQFTLILQQQSAAGVVLTQLRLKLGNGLGEISVDVVIPVEDGKGVGQGNAGIAVPTAILVEGGVIRAGDFGQDCAGSAFVITVVRCPDVT
jgi:hypothetical protein